jgi:O-antigen ligase
MPDLKQRKVPLGLSNRHSGAAFRKPQVSGVAFAFLSAFFVVYCSRPEEWIILLHYIPVAKVTAGGAMLALLVAGRSERKLKDLPREGRLLAGLIILLFVSALLSPVWRGGAFSHTLEFSKIFVIFVLMFLLVTDMRRLRRLIFVQAASMMVVTAISIAKGYNTPRLEGVIGGIYWNSNDLAFAIVLSIPFCLAFLISSGSALRKLGWGVGLLIMLAALFLTASRAGFIDLLISGTVCLWHFGVRGRRYYLIVVTVLLGTLLMATFGKKLVQRFEAISNQTQGDSAYGSYEARKYLMLKAVQGIKQYPILGVGANNFLSYSGTWHEVHMTYLEIAVEGGIPALILYLMIFGCGFRNLRRLRKRRDLPEDYEVFAGAIHSSLVGFAVGALFSPEAYHFFPYFAVAYTSAMVAMVAQRDTDPTPEAVVRGRQRKTLSIYGTNDRRPPLTVPR